MVQHQTGYFSMATHNSAQRCLQSKPRPTAPLFGAVENVDLRTDYQTRCGAQPSPVSTKPDLEPAAKRLAAVNMRVGSSVVGVCQFAPRMDPLALSLPMLDLGAESSYPSVLFGPRPSHYMAYVRRESAGRRQ